MKKLLLSLSLVGAAILGHAQVILNEFYPEPASGESEFFELFNPSNSTINLGCYTLITTVRDTKGQKPVTELNVLTLPSWATIGPKSYFVASADSNFNIVNQINNKPNLKWNNFTSGVTLKRYTVSGNTYNPITNLTTTNTVLKDFLTNSYEYFLFDASGNYVSGFLGGNNNGNVPPSIKNTLGNMAISTANGCSYTINWSNVTNADNSNKSIGNSNGYARLFDCTDWDKTSTSPAPTPGFTNSSTTKTSPNYLGSITASASLSCGKANYKVSSVSGSGLYPVSVQLFYDNNKDSILNPGDTYQAISPDINSVPFTGTFSNIPANQAVILVFRSVNGCVVAQLALRSATGTLVTNSESLICNKSASFKVNGITNSNVTDYSFLFPITVGLYFNGVQVGSNVSVNSFSDITTYSISGYTIPSNTSSPQLRYTTSAGCTSFNKTVGLTSAPAEITVGGGINCNVDPVTGKRTASYNLLTTSTDALAYPLYLKLYEDVNHTGDTTSSTRLGQQFFNNASEVQSQYSSSLNNPNSYIIVVGQANVAGCANTINAIDNSCTVLPVHFATFHATRNKGAVNLKWSTASEQNNSGFNVQRNTGGGWKTIAFVFSQADGGNSSTLLNYEYKDANTERGVTQYRLQQVDIDNKATFSDTRSVMGLAQAAKIMIFPNPTEDGKVTVLFQTPSVREVIISDVTGRMIQQYHEVTGSSLQIAHLPTGFFAVKVVDRTTGETGVEKIIVK